MYLKTVVEILLVSSVSFSCLHHFKWILYPSSAAYWEELCYISFYLNFSLKFTGILTCPWGQKYIFRNLCLSCLTEVWTATPQKGNFHQSRRKYTLWFYLFNFIISFVGSQENVPLIFPSCSSSLLPLRFLFL